MPETPTKLSLTAMLDMWEGLFGYGDGANAPADDCGSRPKKGDGPNVTFTSFEGGHNHEAGQHNQGVI